jgi:hypothetical protein
LGRFRRFGRFGKFEVKVNNGDVRRFLPCRGGEVKSFLFPIPPKKTKMRFQCGKF